MDIKRLHRRHALSLLLDRLHAEAVDRLKVVADHHNFAESEGQGLLAGAVD